MHNSPTGPTLRANPFPEVTDLICRLPLPTLFYRLEAVHLGDLLRISVRPGTKFIKAPSHFQGPHEAHETPQEPRCFTEPTSLSQAEPFPGIRLLNQKRELWLGLHAASATSFALPPLTSHKDRLSPCPGAGILTRFPFVNRAEPKAPPSFTTALADDLGPTDPHSTAVHVEPFSTSVFKDLT